MEDGNPQFLPTTTHHKHNELPTLNIFLLPLYYFENTHTKLNTQFQQNESGCTVSFENAFYYLRRPHDTHLFSSLRHTHTHARACPSHSPSPLLLVRRHPSSLFPLSDSLSFPKAHLSNGAKAQKKKHSLTTHIPLSRSLSPIPFVLRGGGKKQFGIGGK